MIAWIPYLIFYMYWLVKKKPYKVIRIYEFPLCKFSVNIKVW
jgi:hypothetical protein